MEDEKPNLPKLFPKAELRPKKKKLYKKKEYTQDETLRIFNRNYKKSLCFDDRIIDLTDVSPNDCQYITRDLSRIKFDNCEKLIMSFPFCYIKELMPIMPNLKYLGLVLCGIGRFFLHWRCFKTIETLDLTANEISKASSLLGVKHLVNLKTLILANNPICQDKQEREELLNSLNNIDIQLN